MLWICKSIIMMDSSLSKYFSKNLTYLINFNPIKNDCFFFVLLLFTSIFGLSQWFPICCDFMFFFVIFSEHCSYKSICFACYHFGYGYFINILLCQKWFSICINLPIFSSLFEIFCALLSVWIEANQKQPLHNIKNLFSDHALL